MSSGHLPVLFRAFESICLLRCHRSIIMHRYVPSVCFLACFDSPGLSGKLWLGGNKAAWSAVFQTVNRLAPVLLTTTRSSRHQEMHISVLACSCARVLACCMRTHLTLLFLALRRNTALPRLSFRHRACYRVIALLINVSPSQDNGMVFTVCFSRLVMRDI